MNVITSNVNPLDRSCVHKRWCVWKPRVWCLSFHHAKFSGRLETSCETSRDVSRETSDPSCCETSRRTSCNIKVRMRWSWNIAKRFARHLVSSSTKNFVIFFWTKIFLIFFVDFSVHCVSISIHFFPFLNMSKGILVRPFATKHFRHHPRFLAKKTRDVSQDVSQQDGSDVSHETSRDILQDVSRRPGNFAWCKSSLGFKKRQFWVFFEK